MIQCNEWESKIFDRPSLEILCCIAVCVGFVKGRSGCAAVGVEAEENPSHTWMATVHHLQGSNYISISTSILVDVQLRLSSTGEVSGSITSFEISLPFNIQPLRANECLNTTETNQSFLRFTRPTCIPRVSRGACSNTRGLLKSMVWM